MKKTFFIVFIFSMFIVNLSCQRSRCDDFDNLSFVVDYRNFNEAIDDVNNNHLNQNSIDALNVFKVPDNLKRKRQKVNAKVFFFDGPISFTDINFELMKENYRLPHLAEIRAFEKSCDIGFVMNSPLSFGFEEVNNKQVSVVYLVSSVPSKTQHGVIFLPAEERNKNVIVLGIKN